MPHSTQTSIRSGILLTALAVAAAPCFGHGGYHEEIRLCDAQIAADPENAEHWFRRSQLDYLHGDWMRSLMDLETVDRLAPDKYPVELARGQAWMAGGKYPQARRALDAFIKSQPDHAEGHATRARLMMKLGDPDAAAEDYQNALALTKSPEPDLFTETADAYVASGHPEQAIDELQLGMTKLGAIPSLACKALELEISLGRFDAALSRVAAMRESAARPEPWMAKRASVLAQAGRTAESITAWDALRAHLLNLPDPDRSSHSMCILLEQARNALDSLAKTQNPPR